MPIALVIEDDERTLFALAALVEREGWSSVTASTFESAREELREVQPDIVLLDVVLPDGSGLDLLLEIPHHKRPQVLLMSGEESVRRAVDDMALRTVHFLRKPVDTDAVVALLESVRRECKLAKGPVARIGRLIGSSAAMQEMHTLIAKVAPTDFPVYIEGETGSGKELVAEAIHLASGRADKPFVALNCGALPESLIDSELFGHVKGAFTGASAAKKGVFEQVDGGTLFLDEITEMPAELQVRLLRVLETGTLRRIGGNGDIAVDVRVIAASNRPAERAIADGRIREDLFHRVCVFPIDVPPLRSRGDDVVELVEHFLAEIGEQEGRTKRFADAALETLRVFDWPGNVRQLRNAVQRAYIVAEDEIPVHALPPQVRDRTAAAHRRETPADKDGVIEVLVGTTLAEAERALIEATLEEHDGDKRATAEILGISLRTIYNRLKEYAGEASDDERGLSGDADGGEAAAGRPGA